ncbi:MAG TPA: Clp protease N-terminal domain-containing protein [Jatrophihabitans sp.]|nr:Clp protease N-terminal domain-containing protein [Jatrophihabitans sp.]
MPKINIYLPDDLHTAVREAKIPVSAVCQRALADAVSAADSAVIDPPPPNEGSADTMERLRNRLTDRAMMVIDMAAEQTGDRQHVTSVELAEALVLQGNNLALTTLRSVDIEPADLVNELRATVSQALRSDTKLAAASLSELRDRAVLIARGFDNNYIGCEHLLLAILSGEEDDPATTTLRTLGLELQAGRTLVRAAQGGFNHARGNLSLAALSAPVRSVLEEIRQRLGRLERPSG